MYGCLAHDCPTTCCFVTYKLSLMFPQLMTISWSSHHNRLNVFEFGEFTWVCIDWVFTELPLCTPLSMPECCTLYCSIAFLPLQLYLLHYSVESDCISDVLCKSSVDLISFKHSLVTVFWATSTSWPQVTLAHTVCTPEHFHRIKSVLCSHMQQ